MSGVVYCQLGVGSNQGIKTIVKRVLLRKCGFQRGASQRRDAVSDRPAEVIRGLGSCTFANRYHDRPNVERNMSNGQYGIFASLNEADEESVALTICEDIRLEEPRVAAVMRHVDIGSVQHSVAIDPMLCLTTVDAEFEATRKQVSGRPVNTTALRVGGVRKLGTERSREKQQADERGRRCAQCVHS